tara:strand:- start:2136 stop:2504 length:369 start_codon:yes stop_codon:yes gene_type:complete
MDNKEDNIYYKNHINRYRIARICKYPDLTNNIWNEIKKNIILYLTKLGSKNIEVIFNKEKNIVVALECKDINLKIGFYTYHIENESKENNILIIQNVNNKEDFYNTSLYNISNNFYNNIRII